MKKFLFLAVTTTVAVGASACAPRNYTDCANPDGTQACWNAEERKFRWEAGETITIGVDNDTMGAALVFKWNTDFPELKDKLVYRYYESVNGAAKGVEGIEKTQGEAPDVALVIDNEVIGREASLLNLHPYFADLGAEKTRGDVYEAINQSGDYFLSSFFDGMTFSWNKTMVEALGISTTDANNDGLPEAFDTFEKIFAIANARTTRPTFTFTPKTGPAQTKTINEFYPISLDEPWSAYSSLTAGGFKLFGTGDLTKPGFDTPEFLAGLNFIKDFSGTKMSFDTTGTKKAGSSMGWRWDSYLDGEYPFSLVGTWQDVDGKENANNLDFKFSAMPTYKGKQLTPLYKTKGFVINTFTDAPSAASEVLRWLYTLPTFETMINNSSYLPALNETADIYPENFSQNKVEFANGMRFNYLEPTGTLPLAKTKRVMNVYYNIGVTDFYKAVWDGTKTPAVAQTEIASAAAAWITTNNVA
jgi:arabinogalactan oligomer/maltooligosaccharide transport system substrate-binding protein